MGHSNWDKPKGPIADEVKRDVGGIQRGPKFRLHSWLWRSDEKADRLGGLLFVSTARL